ncbi:MAG: hypothetical protein FJ134_17060 [Deltaproteobacteria bacterium]|nr:hypothetical protein [Deltaproteobacteria bacterium]
MNISLARKIDGKKFMWDGAEYETRAQASQIMESYAKEGFEVKMFQEEDKYLVYSRRVAEVQSAG